MAETYLTPEEVRTELVAIRKAHADWKARLNRALSRAGAGLDPAQVARDDICSFGSFLHTAPFAPWVLDRKPFAVITRLHREFHQAAAEVVRATQTGNEQMARDILAGPYQEASDKLLRALDKWDSELALLKGRRREDRAAPG